MGGPGRGQSSSEAQPLPFLGVSSCEDLQDLCLAMGEQLVPIAGLGSFPELRGSLSGHGWEASSLLGGIEGKASVWPVCL